MRCLPLFLVHTSTIALALACSPMPSEDLPASSNESPGNEYFKLPLPVFRAPTVPHSQQPTRTKTFIPAGEVDPRVHEVTPYRPPRVGFGSTIDGPVDLHQMFPLNEADLIAFARLDSIEEICTTELFHSRDQTDPFCNREIYTLSVVEGIKGATTGERIEVSKVHSRLGMAHNDTSWRVLAGELVLVMLAPANEAGVRQPLYTRAHYSGDLIRAVWRLRIPWGMPTQLLNNSHKDYYACTNEAVLSASSVVESAQAYHRRNWPQLPPITAKAPILTYTLDMNGTLTAARTDAVCEHDTLSTLLRQALQSGS